MGPTRGAEAGQKSPHDKSNEPTKEGTLSFVLFASAFTTVSKVSLATQQNNYSIISVAGKDLILMVFKERHVVCMR